MFGFSLRYRLILVVSDALAVFLSFVAAYILRVQLDNNPLLNEIPALTFAWIFFLLLPFWLIIFASLGMYSPRVYEHRIPELFKVLLGAFVGILFVVGIDFVLERPIFPSRLVPVYALFFSSILTLLGRHILRVIRKSQFKKGTGVNHVMIIGNTDATEWLTTVLANTQKSGYNFAAFVGQKKNIPDHLEHIAHYSNFNEALKDIEKLGLNTIIQTEMFEDQAKNKKIWQAAQAHYLDYKFIPSQTELYSGRNTVEVFEGIPIVTVHPTPLIGWGRIAKRIFDIVMSLLIMIPGSIILLVAAITTKAIDPSGPIFYKHKRVTRYGGEFYVYKLRTMYQRYCTGKKSDDEILIEMGYPGLAEEFKKTRKIPNDPRITGPGKIFRATSIDELPQLLNVLKGDISLIGPRPIVKEELKLYKGQQNTLVAIKPGLTGLWQVSGRSDLSIEERVRLDIYYVQNWSFWLDLKIFFKTIYVVLKKTGAR